MRNFTSIDRLLNEAQYFLDTLHHEPQGLRSNPANALPENKLNEKEIRNSQGFMRVNHTGEICAQALYRSQALGTQNTELKQHFNEAAIDETDHLNWCKSRLDELGSHTSYLNPLWYIGSFLIGISAARLGDKLSLGFVEETEKQVIKHLDAHQKALPTHDHKSQAIIKIMREDEARHADNAHQSGAKELPLLLKLIMQLQSKVMTTTAYYL